MSAAQAVPVCMTCSSRRMGNKTVRFSRRSFSKAASTKDQFLFILITVVFVSKIKTND